MYLSYSARIDKNCTKVHVHCALCYIFYCIVMSARLWNIQAILNCTSNEVRFLKFYWMHIWDRFKSLLFCINIFGFTSAIILPDSGWFSGSRLVFWIWTGFLDSGWFSGSGLVFRIRPGFLDPDWFSGSGLVFWIKAGFLDPGWFSGSRLVFWIRDLRAGFLDLRHQWTVWHQKHKNKKKVFKII